MENMPDGSQCLVAEHLSDVDAVDGARHGLEEIGEDEGSEEKEVDFPEGVVGCGGCIEGPSRVWGSRFGFLLQGKYEQYAAIFQV